MRKPVRWMGSSLEDLKSFPVEAKKEAGYQIDLVSSAVCD